jgi:streptomycin 3"-adenylyltransferase
VTNEQLSSVVAVIGSVLGHDILGAYLYGSAVMGGLHPSSDLDVFAVARRRTTRRQRRELVERLTPISARRERPPDWRPVELTIVVASEIRPWRYPPRMDFQYGEWLRARFDAGNVDTGSPDSPDLAVLITMILLANRRLMGLAANDLLEPVPPDDLVRAMLAGIPILLGDLPTDTSNVLLTLGRIWCTVKTGEIRSKDGAAEWALARLAGAGTRALRRACAVYLGEAEDLWAGLEGDAAIEAERIVREIRRHALDAVDPVRAQSGRQPAPPR